VGLCIQTEWLVWINGPYPCGAFPDLKIAREHLFNVLAPGEKVVADGGYRNGGEFTETPNGLINMDQIQKSQTRARPETVNGRSQDFTILKQSFRGYLGDHGFIYKACAVLVQIAI
jgi:hypothetical protein